MKKKTYLDLELYDDLFSKFQDLTNQMTYDGSVTNELLKDEVLKVEADIEMYFKERIKHGLEITDKMKEFRTLAQITPDMHFEKVLKPQLPKPPTPPKKPAETIKDINVPRLQFPKDAKWVNVKFKYITDVEIEIHYADEFIGLFPYTSLDGFYKGRAKTNLWHGLLYIAQKGSIERTALAGFSADAPRKYIDRLNKALERALFKEEAQRPIKFETIDSSKYYVPNFGVIDAQLS